MISLLRRWGALLLAAGCLWWAGPSWSAQIEAFTPQEVMAIAEMVAGRARQNGQLPAYLDLPLVDGGTMRVNAAQIFVMLARLLGEWSAARQLPQAVPVPSEKLTGPARFARQVGPLEAVPVAELAQACQGLPALVDKLGGLPEAVVVKGKPLPAAAVLGGMAAALSDAYRNGALPKLAPVGGYQSPSSWSSASSGANGTKPDSQPASQVSPPAPPPATEVSFLMKGGVTVRGRVNLAIQCEGPPPSFLALLVDDSPCAYTNARPYQFDWNSRDVVDGPHRLTAQALDAKAKPLAEATITLNVLNTDQ